MRSDCEICGGEDVLSLDERRKGVEAVVCRRCGLVWNLLMPTEAEQIQFYQSGYRHGVRLTRGYLLSMLSRAACIVEFLREELRPGLRHLDVGCSEGTLLVLARARGVEVHGLEVDAYSRRFAVRERKLPVVAATLESAAFDPQSFGLVSFSHVIEHLFHPIEQLRRAAQLLPENGLLYVEVPNLHHPSTGPRTHFLNVHNFYFSANTLRSLVYRAGFEPLRMGRSPRDNSLQLLARKSRDVDNSSIPWRDDAERIYRQVKANRRRHFLMLRFISRKVRRHRLKRFALQRYGELLPDIKVKKSHHQPGGISVTTNQKSNNYGFSNS